MIKFGATDIKAVYHGSTEIAKVVAGSDEVWTLVPPDPPALFDPEPIGELTLDLATDKLEPKNDC